MSVGTFKDSIACEFDCVVVTYNDINIAECHISVFFYFIQNVQVVQYHSLFFNVDELL